MIKYPETSILPLRVPSLTIVVTTCLIVACSDSTTVTEYPLNKVNPKDNYGHEWLPLNPTIYRIGKNTVVSETAGILHKHENCTIMSPDSWECQYSDGSGSFGFRNGEFWRRPEWDDTKVVSNFEYNRVRCEWALEDKYEGKLWGVIRCITGWR